MRKIIGPIPGVLIALAMAVVAAESVMRASDTPERLLLGDIATGQAQENGLVGMATTSNVLVAYFTHDANTTLPANSVYADAVTSATGRREGERFYPQLYDGVRKGNTQVIAEYIAKRTGGTLFAIRSEARYPADPYATLEVAGRERSGNARPKLAVAVEGMEGYDTVYLGFPNWYGTMPMPVFTFLESYDFAGKTVIPFSTHDGSGLGRGPRDIQALCPGATMLDGLAVRYDQVGRAEKAVESWLRRLGLLDRGTEKR